MDPKETMTFCILKNEDKYFIFVQEYDSIHILCIKFPIKYSTIREFEYRIEERY